jgi:hypothetical protein
MFIRALLALVQASPYAGQIGIGAWLSQAGPAVGHRGNCSDLEECKRRFKAVWVGIRAGLSEVDIAKARQVEADADRPMTGTNQPDRALSPRSVALEFQSCVRLEACPGWPNYDPVFRIMRSCCFSRRLC